MYTVKFNKTAPLFRPPISQTANFNVFYSSYLDQLLSVPRLELVLEL